MIHVPTGGGGRVEHLVRRGFIARTGDLLARVHPEEGPVEEIASPFDAVVDFQRLHGKQAPRHAPIIGLRRVVLATTEGRVRWVSTLGPVLVGTMVALVVTPEGHIRPHRAPAAGFIGRSFIANGKRIEAGAPLVEIRGEELAG
ncbi:MAG: hypothetical protein ACE366_06005 [Bradymonadia bacterium]